MPNLISPAQTERERKVLSPQVQRAEDHLLETRKKREMGKNTSAQDSKNMMFNSFQDSLKLFIQSVKCQDPMDPADTTAMATQIFQLSQASGLHSMNEKLEEQNDLLRSSQILGISELFGKEIEINSDQFSLKKGEKQEFSFDLPQNVSAAKLQILDSKQGAVYEKAYLPKPMEEFLESGKKGVIWGGEVNTRYGENVTQGHLFKTGDFKIKVILYNAKGEVVTDPYRGENTPLKVNTAVKAKLAGSDFSSNEPRLIMDNNQRLPLSAIVSIQETKQSTDDRTAELKGLFRELERKDKPELTKQLRRLDQVAKKNSIKEENKEHFASQVRNLTPKQFEALKRQIETKLNQ